jgi:hypothetical protein
MTCPIFLARVLRNFDAAIGGLVIVAAIEGRFIAGRLLRR